MIKACLACVILSTICAQPGTVYAQCEDLLKMRDEAYAVWAAGSLEPVEYGQKQAAAFRADHAYWDCLKQAEVLRKQEQEEKERQQEAARQAREREKELRQQEQEQREKAAEKEVKQNEKKSNSNTSSGEGFYYDKATAEAEERQRAAERAKAWQDFGTATLQGVAGGIGDYMHDPNSDFNAHAAKDAQTENSFYDEQTRIEKSVNAGISDGLDMYDDPITKAFPSPEDRQQVEAGFSDQVDALARRDESANIADYSPLVTDGTENNSKPYALTSDVPKVLGAGYEIGALLPQGGRPSFIDDIKPVADVTNGLNSIKQVKDDLREISNEDMNTSIQAATDLAQKASTPLASKAYESVKVQNKNTVDIWQQTQENISNFPEPNYNENANPSDGSSPNDWQISDRQMQEYVPGVQKINERLDQARAIYQKGTAVLSYVKSKVSAAADDVGHDLNRFFNSLAKTNQAEGEATETEN